MDSNQHRASSSLSNPASIRSLSKSPLQSQSSSPSKKLKLRQEEELDDELEEEGEEEPEEEINEDEAEEEEEEEGDEEMEEDEEDEEQEGSEPKRPSKDVDSIGNDQNQQKSSIQSHSKDPSSSTATTKTKSTTSTTGAAPKQHRNKKSYHHLKSNKVLGTTILPVTRVTRAAKQDTDIKIVSKEAVFLISIATEFFIRKLTDSGFDHARKEKRVFVKYNDIAKAIKNNDEYQWLEEVIPVSRPLGSILNDPTIPSASTAITNQLPQFMIKANDKNSNNNLNNGNSNNGNIVIQKVNDDQAGSGNNDTLDNHFNDQSQQQDFNNDSNPIELDEDELDEDL